MNSTQIPLLKTLMKRIIFGHLANSEVFIKYWKKQGSKIGDGTVFHDCRHVFLDPTRPWLIQIGKNVQITRDVTILTHGYDWSVIKGAYGEILGSSGKVTIGDNVFVGMKTTILKSVTVGNNVIIGANSLVNKDIPDNVVAAGNPAKVIMTLEDYRKKRQKCQLSEAVELTLEYYHQYHHWPSKQILREFVWLFEDRKCDVDQDPVFTEIASLVGNYPETKHAFYRSKGKFKNYNDFIAYCKTQLKP